MTEAPMTAQQVLTMAAALAAQNVTGVTGSGPTTKKHRGSGAFLRAVEALDAANVIFARDWALNSGTAAALPADGKSGDLDRVPIVLPDGQVARVQVSTLNSAALLAAEVTCAAEVAVLMGILRKRIGRLAALERLRDTVTQVEAMGGRDT